MNLEAKAFLLYRRLFENGLLQYACEKSRYSLDFFDFAYDPTVLPFVSMYLFLSKTSVDAAKSRGKSGDLGSAAGQASSEGMSLTFL